MDAYGQFLVGETTGRSILHLFCLVEAFFEAGCS